MAVEKKLTASERRLAGEGAEFLVLGNLLTRGIHAAKAYSNFPVWDILAFDEQNKKQVTIQVKSIYASDGISFLLRDDGFDFLVIVRLNKGLRYTKTLTPESDQPQFWILPKSTLSKMIGSKKKSEKYGEWSLSLNSLSEEERKLHLNGWHLIAQAIAG